MGKTGPCCPTAPTAQASLPPIPSIPPTMPEFNHFFFHPTPADHYSLTRKIPLFSTRTMNCNSLPSPRDICRGEATFQPVKQCSSLWTSAMGLDLLLSIQLCGGRAQHPQLLVPALCQKATGWAALQYFLTYLLRINQYKEWLFRLCKPARLILVGILQESSHNCLNCQR